MSMSCQTRIQPPEGSIATNLWKFREGRGSGPSHPLPPSLHHSRTILINLGSCLVILASPHDISPGRSSLLHTPVCNFLIILYLRNFFLNEEGLMGKKRPDEVKNHQYLQGQHLCYNKALGILLGEGWESNFRGWEGDFLHYCEEEMRKESGL